MKALIPGKQIEMEYNNSGKLNLFVDMGVGIGGDKWPAAELFCHFITHKRWKKFFSDLFANTTCLELGSGNGLAGILIDMVFDPKSVVITDLESHIEHISKNISLNAVFRSTALPFDWMNTDPNQVPGTFDFIFALECVYWEDLFQALITTIRNKSHSKTVTFLGMTRQFATSNKGPVFFDLLSSSGFTYKKVPLLSVPPSSLESVPVDENIGIFVVYR